MGIVDKEQGPAGDAGGTTRAVTDVETLKALADPTRLALLAALMRPASVGPRVMSVKELAAEIGEPQTKLYRHVKHLEAAGLIRAASSRLVSGILEQRYQACQHDLTLGPGLTHDEKSGDESQAMVAAVLDRYRSRFFAARRAEQRSSAEASPAHLAPVLSMVETRVPAARAAAIRERLQEVISELSQPPDDDDAGGVLVEVLVGFSSPAAPDIASQNRPGAPPAGS